MKRNIPLFFGAALFIVERGIDFSGLVNLPAAIAMWSIGGVLVVTTLSLWIRHRIRKQFILYEIFEESFSTQLNLLAKLTQKRTPNTVRIIAATGKTVFGLLEKVLNRTEIRNAEFQIILVNPDEESLCNQAASHWKQETDFYITTRLPDLKKKFNSSRRSLDLKWKTYNHFPCVQGVFYNDQHLFLSWFQWEKQGKKYELAGADNFFLQINKGDDLSEQYFDLFLDWFQYTWREK